MTNPVGSKLCGQATRKGPVCSNPVGPKGICAAGHRSAAAASRARRPMATQLATTDPMASPAIGEWPHTIGSAPGPIAPEPPVGTWVRDRYGGVAQRQPSGGWATPGTEPFGRWADMWAARGPLVPCGPWGTDQTPHDDSPLRWTTEASDRIVPLIDDRGFVEASHQQIDAAAQWATGRVEHALTGLDGHRAASGALEPLTPARESLGLALGKLTSAERHIKEGASARGTRRTLAAAHTHLRSARIAVLAHTAAERHLATDDGPLRQPFDSIDGAHAELTEHLGRDASDDELDAFWNATFAVVDRIRAHRRRIADIVGRHPDLTLDQCVIAETIDRVGIDVFRPVEWDDLADNGHGNHVRVPVDEAIARFHRDGHAIRRLDGTRIDIADTDLAAALHATSP